MPGAQLKTKFFDSFWFHVSRHKSDIYFNNYIDLTVLQKAQKTVSDSDSQYKTLTDKVPSLTVKVSWIRLERDNPRRDLNEMTAPVQPEKEGIRSRCLSCLRRLRRYTRTRLRLAS